MGTDIHYFAEKRVNDSWDYLPCSFYFGGNRNYSLFRVLAGVRGELQDVPPIARRRGFPADLSQVSQDRLLERIRYPYDEFLQDDIEHHGHSWVLLKELIDFPWDKNLECIQAGKSIQQETIPTLSKLGEPEDIRIVFWFDA